MLPQIQVKKPIKNDGWSPATPQGARCVWLHQDVRLNRCHSLELCLTRIDLPEAWFTFPIVHREAYGNVNSNHICLTNYPPNLLSPHNYRVETISVANTDHQAFQGVTYDPTTPAGIRFSQVDLPPSGVLRPYCSFASLTPN